METKEKTIVSALCTFRSRGNGKETRPRAIHRGMGRYRLGWCKGRR